MSKPPHEDAYVVQIAAHSGEEDPRIFKVCGDAAESQAGSAGGWSFKHHLFTKAEAEAVAAYLNDSADATKRLAFVRAMEAMFKATGKTKVEEKQRKRSGQTESLFKQEGHDASGSSL